MARKQTYNQMMLPFDRAELRKPAPVTPVAVTTPALPPGLREFATAESLSDARVRKLAEVYDTIRGRRPVSLEEWRQFYTAVKPYFTEEAK